MYVLCSPCILEPGLRAEGITSGADLALFRKARERCRRFAIDMIPLPCPETVYLGPARKPGTFLERLNTPEFAGLLKGMEREVRKIIEEHGPPLALLGVNSSPTCGVTQTYYGSLGNGPPRRPGRGVFLSRFPDLRAMDVGTFSRFRVYLAAPLFSDAERAYNAHLAAQLERNLFEVYLPQEAGDDSAARGKTEQHRLFRTNLQALEDSDIIVGIVDGPDADSGTAWEMGYAFAHGKPVYAIRTDFRRAGDHELVNLMLEESATVVGSATQLLQALGSPYALTSDA